MPRTAKARSDRAALVVQLNAVNRSIEYIDSQYFHAHPMDYYGRYVDGRNRKAVAPEVRERMKDRLADLREQQAGLMAQLDAMDTPELETWYAR